VRTLLGRGGSPANLFLFTVPDRRSPI
jgi:hypothetical protein